MAKDPTVNAILRGVYFKDEPVDLESGKYTNRLQLLKVPRLTKERILRVSPDFPFVKSVGNTIKSGANITKDLTNTGFLYNQLTLKLYRTAPILTKYELQISIMDTTGEADLEILSTHIVQRAKAVVRTFTFNPSHDVNLYLGNNGSDDIIIDYTFSYSELEQSHIISLDSRISASAYISKYFSGFNRPINRMRIILYQAGTLNATITLKQHSNHPSMADTLVNFTVTSGTNYTNFFDFNPCSYFSLLIENDNAGQELSFQIILFFSKNLKPELDEHINTTNIHFLESSIDLANLNEKSYNSLDDLPLVIRSVSTYTGNGASDRTIPLGYQPRAICLMWYTNDVFGWKHQSMGANDSMSSIIGKLAGTVSIVATGFKLNPAGANVFWNTNGHTFTFIAFE